MDVLVIGVVHHVAEEECPTCGGNGASAADTIGARRVDLRWWKLARKARGW